MTLLRPARAGDAGYVRLVVDGDRARPADLFVDPEHIGTGLGRLLRERAPATARAAGAVVVTLESDPHAEPFSRHLGARRTGDVETSPGRRLPVMSVDPWATTCSSGGPGRTGRRPPVR